MNTDNCKCGSESEFGAHGVSGGKVFSEHYCSQCWNKREDRTDKFAASLERGNARYGQMLANLVAAGDAE